MKKQNRKQVAIENVTNEKSGYVAINQFNRQSSKFNDYPVEADQFNDCLTAAIVSDEARLTRVKAMMVNRKKADQVNQLINDFNEAVKVYEAMPEKTRNMLKIQKPVNPFASGKKPVNVSVKTEGNTKRNLTKVFQAILNDNKDGLTKSESAYASQLKSVYNAMCNKGKGDLNTALANTLDKTLDEKLAALKAYADKTGKDTFYRNNSPYVKTLQAMIDNK